MKPKREKKSTPIEGEVIDTKNTTDATTAKQRPERYVLPNSSIVTKSNDLIQKTRYSLPKVQQKILLAMIAQIDPIKDNDPNKIYTMSFSDFSKLTGVDMSKYAYRNYIRDTIGALSASYFWLDEKSAKSSKDKLIRWIGEETDIDYTNREIHLQFSKRIFPYLTQLKSNYTSFNVEYLLHMNSTYAMRFYEILLSWDNGDTDYGYTNNIVFQPVTEEILDKFPEKASEIKGFKYKVFDIEALKEQLSPAPTDSKKDGSPKEKSLNEKYPNFGDFERFVLVKAKNEINKMTDLWFDYVPVRKKGYGRTFQRIYLFIKYKNEAEMKTVRDFLHNKDDGEVPRKSSRKRKEADAAAKFTQTEKATNGVNSPIEEDVFDLTVTKAVRLLETKTELESIKDKISDSTRLAASNVITYTARLLTNKNVKKAQTAHDTRDALNRVIQNYGTLKYWVVGMAQMMQEKQANGQLKSPQYNATIVFNAIEDMKVIADGKNALGYTDIPKGAFKIDFSVFDE